MLSPRSPVKTTFYRFFPFILQCRNWRDMEVGNLLRTPQSACQRDADKFWFEVMAAMRVRIVSVMTPHFQIKTFRFHPKLSIWKVSGLFKENQCCKPSDSVTFPSAAIRLTRLYTMANHPNQFLQQQKSILPFSKLQNDLMAVVLKLNRIVSYSHRRQFNTRCVSEQARLLLINRQKFNLTHLGCIQRDLSTISWMCHTTCCYRNTWMAKKEILVLKPEGMERVMKTAAAN